MAASYALGHKDVWLPDVYSMDMAIGFVLFGGMEPRGAPHSRAVGGLLPLPSRVEFGSPTSRARWGADSVLLLG